MAGTSAGAKKGWASRRGGGGAGKGKSAGKKKFVGPPKKFASMAKMERAKYGMTSSELRTDMNSGQGRMVGHYTKAQAARALRGKPYGTTKWG